MTAATGSRWTARQLAMLRAMGIDLGVRPSDAPDADAETPSAARDGTRSGTAAAAGGARTASVPPTASRGGAASAEPSAFPGVPRSDGPRDAGRRPDARSAAPTAPPTPPAPHRIDRYIDDLASAASAAPAPATEDAAAQPAHWLVVGEPLPPGSPPAKLMAAMLRSVGWLSAEGAPRERRAALALFEPGADLAFDRARLMDAVQRASPRCIVVFGRAHARALLSTELPLAELRGRVHRLGETPVIVTFAVPYLLRQPAEKARAWEDLCLATRACEATA